MRRLKIAFTDRSRQPEDPPAVDPQLRAVVRAWRRARMELTLIQLGERDRVPSQRGPLRRAS